MKTLRGTVNHYPWGSLTTIPSLLGVPPDGRPQSELWLGAHASSPSTVEGRSLRELVSLDPVATVGRPASEAFGACLPYLLKVLAAERPLSLQAHPSRAQAERGHAREAAAGVASDDPERLYQDDWPKPELLCALTDFEALSGFRDPLATYALFVRLGAPRVLTLLAPLQQGSAQALRTVFESLVRADIDPRVRVELLEAAQASQAAEVVSTERGSEVGSLSGTIIELENQYPGDPGVLAATLLNRVTLRPGEAIYAAPGNLHAYLRGTGVEVMASSDNVLRGGLTGKHVAIDELLGVLDFSFGPTPVIRAMEDGTGVWRYPTDAPEFALWRIELTSVPQPLPAEGAGRIVLVTEGAAQVHGASGGHPAEGCENPSATGQPQPTVSRTLRRGESGFVLPGERLTVSGAGTLFLAAPGL